MDEVSRFAVRVVESGRILAVGLPEDEAQVRADSYNFICGEGAAEYGEIEWRFKGITPTPSLQ